MTFGLIGWLKSRHPEINYEIPVWYPGSDQPDNREWLITNGLGGYSMGTVSGANTRRYHSYLTAALTPPVSRRVVLSRVEELITVNGVAYELASNYWASGVVSPTGFKRLDCFTILPTPTWVYDLGGPYLVKRLNLAQGSNTLTIGYTFLSDIADADDPSAPAPDVRLTTRFLVGFRDNDATVKGSSERSYPQFVSPNQSLIILNEAGNRLCLTWNSGTYESQKQWWWDYNWPEESARGEADGEDLFLVGSLTANLFAGTEHSLAASFEEIAPAPDCAATVNDTIKRQNKLISRASLPRSSKTDTLILACDQFFVPDAFDRQEKKTRRLEDSTPERLSIIEGYPWFNDSGRAALMSLSGLALTTRRFNDARAILRTFAQRMRDGVVANRTIDPLSPFVALVEPGLEYNAVDVSLWYGQALYSYYRVTRDKELVIELLPALLAIFSNYFSGTIAGITVDRGDGLLRSGMPDVELTWMDSKVEDIPITPRAGKAVEVNALWYSFLQIILYLAGEAQVLPAGIEQIKNLALLAKNSMQKFWNAERRCLYDVIEKEGGKADSAARDHFDASLRPNQLLAVSAPFRAFSADQERQIISAVENSLLTPIGLRTLSPDDNQYQGSYGCGFQHADRYHRDLSYHQGTAWTWLTGIYVEALINVHGSTPETAARVNLLLAPLTSHLLEDGCLGSMSEIFDGSRPHLARGCPAHAAAVAASMRWVGWQARQ